MSDLRFNTIAGTVLAAGLFALGLREVSTAVFHVEHHETPAYAIALAEAAPAAGAGPAAETGPPDFGRLLADPAELATLISAGEREVRVCVSCHAFEADGGNGTGPNLHDVFGRVAGTHAGFAYSEAMRAYAQPWSYDNLYAYLEAPARYVRGTTMSFAGLRQSEDRVAVIAYLRSLAPNPAPLPAPLPEAPAASGETSDAPVATTAAEGVVPNVEPQSAATSAGAPGAPPTGEPPTGG